MTYAFIPDAVISALPGLSLSAAKIAVAVASFMNESGECFPSHVKIGKRAGIPRRNTIGSALSELRDKGLISWERRGKRSNLYQWTTAVTDSQCGEKRYNKKPQCGEKRYSKVLDVAENDTHNAAKSDTQNNTTEVVNTSAEGKEAIPAELRGLDLYEVDAKLLEQWPSLLKSWNRAYPGVDIPGEVAKAHAWEVANPQRRKKDRARFLTNWLGRVKVEPLPAEAEPPPLSQAFIDEMEGKAAS